MAIETTRSRSCDRHVSRLLFAILLVAGDVLAGGRIYTFDISPGPADVGLKVYANVTGRKLLFPHDVVRLHRSNEVIGRFDADDALRRLLRDSGLVATISDKGNLIIKVENMEGNQVTIQSPTDSAGATDANTKPILGRLGAAIAALALSIFANAQEPTRASARIVEEIIVTAQKREQSIQDVGVAVSAFSGEQIEQLGIRQGFQIADQVPNFNFNAAGEQAGPIQYLNIRGIQIVDFSASNDPSVAVYRDEVYQPSQGAAISQMFDVERVEVLRGPQGTLFGRNTSGGLLHVINRRPTDEFEGYITAGYGEHDRYEVEGAVSGGLTDSIRARVAGRFLDQGGWQTDGVTGEDSYGETDSWNLRGTLEVDLSDSLTATLIGHVSETDVVTPGGALFGERDPSDPGNGALRCSAELVAANTTCVNAVGFRDPNPDPETVYIDVPNAELVQGFDWPRDTFADAYGGNLTLNWDTGWGEFVSITGYENFDSQINFQWPDRGDRDIAVSWGGEWESFSQEFRVGGEARNGGSWVAGVYYYQDDKRKRSSILTGVAPNPTIDRGSVESNTWALFAQTETPISDTLSLVLGARFTDDNRSLEKLVTGNGVTPDRVYDVSMVDEVDAQELTGKVALEWRPGDEFLGYASFSRGYKSGSINPEDLQFPTRVGPTDPEVVYAWELGWKSTMADGLVRFNGAVFYYDFQAYQSLVTNTVLDPSVPEGFTSIVQFINAGSADIYGAELEFSWSATENLFLSLGVGLLDTKFSSPETVTVEGVGLDGNKLPNAPDYSFNGVARYSIPTDGIGTFTLQGDFRYQDDIYHNIDNNPFEVQEAYGIVNFRVFWNSPSERFTVQAFLENAFDEEYTTQSLYSTASPTAFKNWGRPQWWGMRISYDFSS